MTADVLLQRGRRVADLSSAVASGANGLQDVPALLRILLDDDGWRDFITLRGDHRQPVSFAAFVTTAPLAGLGAESVEQLQRLVGNDRGLLDLIDVAIQRPVGTNVPLSNRQGQAPSGTTVDAALRRLRKDRPDLHADVIADKLSPHAAMVAAGFRPRTFTVRADDPLPALRRHLSTAQLVELAQQIERIPGPAS